jgi:hypothetical protein
VDPQLKTPTEDDMPVSFATDIAPIFESFYKHMIWRFDLRNYDQVKANALLIDSLISADVDGGRMPPANFGPPISGPDQLTFKQWIAEGFPP